MRADARRIQARGHPTSSIPHYLTYPLLLESYHIINNIHANNSALAAGLCAAFALGYGLSLRASEYLSTSSPTALNHPCTSTNTHIVYDSAKAFNVSDPSAYPAGIPSHILILIDFRKAGESNGIKAIAHNPSAPVDCLQTIFTFLQQHPPQPNQPLLSGLGDQITAAHVKNVLNLLADKFGFERKRLQPHSSIRSGALAQVALHDAHTRGLMGNWGSSGSMAAYERASLAHANKISADIHNPILCPIALTQPKPT